MSKKIIKILNNLINIDKLFYYIIYIVLIYIKCFLIFFKFNFKKFNRFFTYLNDSSQNGLTTNVFKMDDQHN